MPRDGSLTPADLIGQLDVLRVECEKCGRSGRYRVDRLVQQLGRDGKANRLAVPPCGRLSAQAQDRV
jgi:hypothetical protein